MDGRLLGYRYAGMVSFLRARTLPRLQGRVRLLLRALQTTKGEVCLPGRVDQREAETPQFLGLVTKAQIEVSTTP